MAENEMVERVAKAIFKDWALDWFEDSWEAEPELTKNDYRGAARAAIEAMRDPTSHVIVAVEAMAEERYRACPGMQRWYGEDVWNAGIDAALSTEENSNG